MICLRSETVDANSEIDLLIFTVILRRDKKTRRTEKQKGKKKEDDGSKHVSNGSGHAPTSPAVVEVNHQDGDAVPDVPPISEEV